MECVELRERLQKLQEALEQSKRELHLVQETVKAGELLSS